MEKQEDKSVFPNMISAGMTLREHYAGLAMQGLCANSEYVFGAAATSRQAVIQADALIAELEKRGE